MALTIDSTITDVVGASGASIAKEIVGGISGTVFWRAEQYIFQNGSLASGISLNGLSNSGGYLQAGIGADNDESNDTQVSIRNIDFTNYSKMDIVLNYRAGANYGSGTVAYGIDSYWTTALPGSYGWTSTTITIDISSYTGTHYIGFGLAAENNSSEPTWGAWANIQIAQIRLYN